VITAERRAHHRHHSKEEVAESTSPLTHSLAVHIKVSLVDRNTVPIHRRPVTACHPPLGLSASGHAQPVTTEPCSDRTNFRTERDEVRQLQYWRWLIITASNGQNCPTFGRQFLHMVYIWRSRACYSERKSRFRMRHFVVYDRSRDLFAAVRDRIHRPTDRTGWNGRGGFGWTLLVVGVTTCVLSRSDGAI